MDGPRTIAGHFEGRRARPAPLDSRELVAYTSNMSDGESCTNDEACLCLALRQASRAVSRLYDEELRGVGLRTTQYSLLRVIQHFGEVRQRDLAERTLHDETSLTRGLRPLVEAGWIAVRSGDDRREKWLGITEGGEAKLAEARPAWERAQARMRERLAEETRRGLMEALLEVSKLAARP